MSTITNHSGHEPVEATLKIIHSTSLIFLPNPSLKTLKHVDNCATFDIHTFRHNTYSRIKIKQNNTKGKNDTVAD